MKSKIRMNAKVRQLVCSLVLLALGIAPDAQARLTADQLKEAIKQENAARGSATVAVDNTQASISTFRAEGASDKDCKIDAILLAKTVFDHDPELVKVVVRFHDLRNNAEYWEAKVSVSDVAAFGAGAISKEQLFTAMDLRHENPTASTPGSVASAAVKGEALPVVPKKPSLSVSSVSSASSMSATGGMGRFDAYGLTLKYVPRWIPSKPSTGNAIVRLSSQIVAEHPAIIELRVYSAQQVTVQKLLAARPEVTFNDPWKLVVESSLPASFRRYMRGIRLDNEQYLAQHPEMGTAWYNVQTAPVKIQPAVKVGAGKPIMASQKAYWVSSKYTPREYMRTVIIPTPKYVYQLNMVAAEADAGTVNTDFEQMLALLTFGASK